MSHPSLPTISPERIRRSKNGPRRAWVLLGVHLLFAAHITHYVLQGRTISPVEPSESMYTLELGQLNAGFIFFGVALLATLVFGRFFCGWGCHIVALQDLCAWMLKKVGIRPRPLRSRALLLLPLGLALYMFVWPTFKRFVFPHLEALHPMLEWFGLRTRMADFPGLSDHLTTDSFWATFPGPLFTTLTFLVCGFVAVYFLGAKGFCTYGCPYGAFFGIVDRWSPGRIRVTDDCEGCGHCSAVCTSNVVVHQEVADHGMVVDPGCMKCMDCVSVCPKEALYFGFGKPAALARTKSSPIMAKLWSRSRVGDYTLLAVALVAGWAFRGLYNGPPLLMAFALGGITAMVALILWRLFKQKQVRLQQLVLKSAGKITGTGRVVALLSVLWLAFTAHSWAVKWSQKRGAYHLAQAEVSWNGALSGAQRLDSLQPDDRDDARKMIGHYRRADRWGILDTPDVKSGLALGALLEGDADRAVERLKQAIALRPADPAAHETLVHLLTVEGDLSGAREALEAKVEQSEGTALDWFRLGELAAREERNADAARAFAAGLQLEPGDVRARFNLGGLLRRLDRPDEAIVELERVREATPRDFSTRVELGLAYRAVGRNDEAIAQLREAIRLAPDSYEAREYLPGLIAELEAAGMVNSNDEPGGKR